MHGSNRTILLLLGGNFHSDIAQIEQTLPHYLRKFARVTCFEFPQFTKLRLLMTARLPLIEEVTKNLTIFHSTGILPAGRSITLINYLNYSINALLLRYKIGQKFDIVISFTPEYSIIANFIDTKRVIYHVLDDYETLPWWGNMKSSRNQLRNLEVNMLRLADRVIVVSPNLMNKYRTFHHDVQLFQTPAYLEYYYKRQLSQIPIDLKSIHRPIIGFAGSAPFNGKLDLDLLKKLFKAFPSYSYVFVGVYSNSIQKRLETYHNCYFLGYKSLDILPQYVSNFDVCLVPYMMNRFGKSAYPVKIMEYLSLGKPVVTTALPSVKYLAYRHLIYWSKNHNEFVRNVKKAVQGGMNEKKLVRARIKEGLRNDWSARIGEYMRIIDCGISHDRIKS